MRQEDQTFIATQTTDGLKKRRRRRKSKKNGKKGLGEEVEKVGKEKIIVDNSAIWKKANASTKSHQIYLVLFPPSINSETTFCNVRIKQISKLILFLVL